jgi:hypothetical protein
LFDRQTVDDLDDTARVFGDLLGAALLIFGVDEAAQLHRAGKGIHGHVIEFVNGFFLQFFFDCLRDVFVVGYPAFTASIVPRVTRFAPGDTCQDHCYTQTAN